MLDAFAAGLLHRACSNEQLGSKMMLGFSAAGASLRI
jgi:hypothetical protein